MEARLLVVGVGVVAQKHPDRRVQHLGCHAILVLLDQPRPGVMAARVQALPTHVVRDVEVVRRLPGGGQEPQRHTRSAVVDIHHRAELLVGHPHRGAVAECRGRCGRGSSRAGSTMWESAEMVNRLMCPPWAPSNSLSVPGGTRRGVG